MAPAFIISTALLSLLGTTTSVIFTTVALLLGIVFLYDKVTKNIITRRGAGNGPNASFGLESAHTYKLPAPAGGIDIIFIHGLGSNPDTTWQATASPESKEHVTWVRDFLPIDLVSDGGHQDIRLFFYNYDSYWKRDALPERLTTLGSALVGWITSQIRTTDAERSRHLVFVAHSYGGLVVKKALLHAQGDPSLSYVAENTKAIFFLGTPHSGSSFSVWGRWQARALSLLRSNSSILADLDCDSILLRDLHHEFARIDRATIFNFYEQRPIQLARLWFFTWEEYCVSESSATYAGPRVKNFGLSVDHYGLNKFGSRDVNYRNVLGKLNEVTLSLAAEAKCSYVVPLETVESYTQRKDLWSELEDKMRIRHDNASVPYAVAISGLGGVGKSQLALKFAETHKDHYNPILWVDATDKELVLSSFQRLATELQLQINANTKHGSVLIDDGNVQAVLRWLSKADGKWLVIIDNADDFTFGIKNVIPKGPRGSVLITSQNELSIKLIPRGCEQIQVGDMSPQESTTLLLHHLRLSIDSPVTEIVTTGCKQVAEKLGYLALAIDLAGAYIGNEADPEDALTQYLDDFTRHGDALLQIDRFQELRPTQKTVWTVWDTTLQQNQ
ncbi:alpha/beta-Hydrolase [Glarea lozoyensis ATCC 20868]|uniref:Alpha/beta-Hydrolase n=1 Tax=Glarea lozoyensis (strain ATCC 20868 / MF5171) TaxID=1116229 RepID=S3DBN1_GLAL2|nr:alpha/beta-Hydrolase [Glarea lozoyensis ATCC 20868]EPE35145.1 alpha/beta-Hydrolase [Glarea lozoyensis ATCC 20868]